jgi:hypothetical protein
VIEMAKKSKLDKIYQFKIELSSITPKIWRRIQVPADYTFWDLHVAIQSAMGWSDSHLHEFIIFDKPSQELFRIGIPCDDCGEDFIAGWKKKLSSFFKEEKMKAGYIYDFGDAWDHLIKFEKILTRQDGINYPICIDGEMACPPEDCGGAFGYDEFLNAIKNPKHREHKEMLKWIGGKFNPEEFDPKKVKFIDPVKRRKDLLGRVIMTVQK